MRAGGRIQHPREAHKQKHISLIFQYLPHVIWFSRNKISGNNCNHCNSDAFLEQIAYV